MSFGDNEREPNREWFERGPDKRTREHWDHAARTLADQRHQHPAGSAFSRFYVRAFGIAALIGLLSGVVVIAARLWHFYVSPLF